MIEATGISKKFNGVTAVNLISVNMNEGTVFGLIGTNGAGKSTFLRMVAGVLKADSGVVLIDGQPVFENVEAKKKIFYISDDQYFFANGTPKDMGIYYQSVYGDFDQKKFNEFLERFELDKKRKINTFSKGMKKQLSIICGICANTKYLLCDETFDGLDPVMRQGVKSLFASEIEERQLTPIIASHNLRELEDICDYVGILHKGGVLLSKDLDEMKGNIHKIQCVFAGEEQEKKALKGISILKSEHRGTLLTLTVRGEEEEITAKLAGGDPLFLEVLPLSLEEIFISETEVVGYDIKKLIF